MDLHNAPEAYHTTIIYHEKCTDGLTAAAILKAKHEDTASETETVSFVPYTIERGFPLTKVQEDKPQIVVCVDCAPPNVESLHALANLVGIDNLIILDHHKTNIDFLEQHPDLFNTEMSVLDKTKSGAGITWDFCSNHPRPTMVDYVEDRDLWAYKYPNTLAFFSGIGTVEPTIDNYVAVLRDEDWVDDLVKLGTDIREYIQARVDATCKTNTLHTTVAGYSCVIVNCTDNMSDVANQLLINHPEKQIGICYYHIPATNEFKVSMRSRKEDTVDVSAICATFQKGGGHFNAAACVMSPEVFTSTFNVGKHK